MITEIQDNRNLSEPYYIKYKKEVCDSIWFHLPYDWTRATNQFMRAKLKLFKSSFYWRFHHFSSFFTLHFVSMKFKHWLEYVYMPFHSLSLFVEIGKSYTNPTLLFQWSCYKSWQIFHIQIYSRDCRHGSTRGPCLVGPTATSMFSS